MLKGESEIREYLLEKSNNGTFSESYSSIARSLKINMSQTVKIMQHLVKIGFIKENRHAKRGRYSNPEWKIVSDVVTQPTVDGSDDIIHIDFQGVDIMMCGSPIGYVISKESLAITTLSDETLIDKIMEANPESFEGNTIMINSEMWLNKFAILSYLTKLNLTRVIQSKRDTLHQFQQSVLVAMTDVILKGRVVMTPENHIIIKNNLRCLTEITPEQIDILFHDIEKQVEGLLGNCTTTVAKQKSQIDNLYQNNTKLESRLDNVKMTNNKLISENLELKSQLLSRGN